MANACRFAPSRFRLHRGLVQHSQASQLARLLQPSRVGVHPPLRRPSGGIINTSNLSVKADQAHLVLVRGIDVVHLMHDGRSTPHVPTVGVRLADDTLVYDVGVTPRLSVT